MAGDALVVDAFPGIHTALTMPPSGVEVRALKTNGTELAMRLDLPDVRAALVLKAHSYRGRFADGDAEDVWRLLEAAFAAGHSDASWPTTSEARSAAAYLRRFFGAPAAPGARRASASREIQARIRNLTLRLVPDVGAD